MAEASPAPRRLGGFPVEQEGRAARGAARSRRLHRSRSSLLPVAAARGRRRSSTASTRSPRSRPMLKRRHGERAQREQIEQHRRGARRATVPRQPERSPSAGAPSRRPSGGARRARPRTRAAPMRATPEPCAPRSTASSRTPTGPGRPAPLERRGRRRAGSSRRTSTSIAAGRRTRGRIASWPSAADADLFVILGTCHAGMADPFAAHPQGLRHAARRRPRSTATSSTRSQRRAGMASRLRAGAPHRALDRVPGGVAPPSARGRGGRSRSCRCSPASLTRPLAADAIPRPTPACRGSSTRSLETMAAERPRVVPDRRRRSRPRRARASATRSANTRRARARSSGRGPQHARGGGGRRRRTRFFESVARDGDRRRICGLSPIYTLPARAARRAAAGSAATASGRIPRARSRSAPRRFP